MPTTPRELRRRIEDTQDDMRAQYEAPFCEIAHQEFEIPQTPLADDQRENAIEQFRNMGIEIPTDSIKLTTEHREFHEMMRRIVLGLDAGDAGQVMSAGLAIGRRIGMADAVTLMSSDTRSDEDINPESYGH